MSYRKSPPRNVKLRPSPTERVILIFDWTHICIGFKTRYLEKVGKFGSPIFYQFFLFQFSQLFFADFALPDLFFNYLVCQFFLFWLMFSHFFNSPVSCQFLLFLVCQFFFANLTFYWAVFI